VTLLVWKNSVDPDPVSYEAQKIRRREIAVECGRLADTQGSHEGKARRVHKGELSFVQPPQRLPLEVFADEDSLHSWRSMNPVEEINGRRMPARRRRKVHVSPRK